MKLQPFRAVSPAGRRWRRAPFGYATGNRALGAFIYFDERRQAVGADPGDERWRGGRWRPGRHERNFNALSFDAALIAIDRYLDRATKATVASAVICNNLKEAVGRADDADMAALPAFVAFFYNEAPSACWGSLDKMTKYMAAKAVKRTGL